MRLQNISVSLLLGILLLAGISGSTDFANSWPLSGVYYQRPWPVWSLHSWTEGRYQAEATAAYEEKIGFRWFFVRLRNQVHYSLFKRSFNPSITIGKDDQVIPYDFYMDYQGETFVGRDSLRNQVDRMHRLDSILKRWQKPMVVTIAPSKVWMALEALPDGFVTEPNPNTNYLVAKAMMDSAGINILDLNCYFTGIKDSVGVPLFANTGVHWNAYGMTLALQRLIEHLEAISAMDLKNVKLEGYTLGEQLHPDDQDLGNLMNLLFPVETQPQPWPIYSGAEQPGASTPRLLLIADSFFFGFLKMPATWQYLDTDTRFWYYGNTEHGAHPTSTPTSELSAIEAVKQADFVVFLSTTGNMEQFSYGFPQKFLDELQNDTSASQH